MTREAGSEFPKTIVRPVPRTGGNYARHGVRAGLSAPSSSFVGRPVNTCGVGASVVVELGREHREHNEDQVLRTGYGVRVRRRH